MSGKNLGESDLHCVAELTLFAYKNDVWSLKVHPLCAREEWHHQRAKQEESASGRMQQLLAGRPRSRQKASP